MGELIPFRHRVEALRRGAEIGPEGAEILFFLGVRYERCETAPDTPDTDVRARKGGAGKPRGPRKRRA